MIHGSPGVGPGQRRWAQPTGSRSRDVELEHHRTACCLPSLVMRSLARSLLISSVALAALALVPRCAKAQEGDESEGVAMRQNRGLKVGLGPTLVLPLHDNGAYGFGLNIDG